MLLVLQIAQYEAVALEVKTLLLVLFWTVFRIMRPGPELDNKELMIKMIKCSGGGQPWTMSAYLEPDPRARDITFLDQ